MKATGKTAGLYRSMVSMRNRKGYSIAVASAIRVGQGATLPEASGFRGH
jgi:hypothetical protein